MATRNRQAPAAAAAQQDIAVVDDTRPIVPGVEVITDENTLAELTGVEGAGRSDHVEDRGTPLLYLAQKGTPQIDKKQANYVKGLEVGMAFNNLTGEHWDAENEGVVLLPCFFRVTWDEWTPRDEGGGFHGSHPRDVDMAALKATPREGRADIYDLPGGNELKLTHAYFCVVESTWQPIVVPMSSTNLGASRKIQSLIDAQKIQVNGRIVTKPAFWSRFVFRSVYDENDQGSWYKWTASIDGPTESPQLRDFCKQFALSCARNEVKVSAPSSETGGKEGPTAI